MKIEYDPPRIENDYQNFKKNTKKYGKQFAEDLEDLLVALDAAMNALDIYNVPLYKMHMLHGKYDGTYSLSPDNKKSKWRVLAICVDENGKEVKPDGNEKEFLSKIKTLRLREVSKHYE